MVGLSVAAQIAENDEWLTAAKARAQNNLLSATGLYSNTMARVGLALVAVARDDAAAAEEQYTALVSVPGIMVFYIGTDQVLGLLSVTLGRLDLAVAHFEDSLGFCRKAGYRPNLAWTCHDYAHALLQRNKPGDRGNAMSLLDEALAISTELGMRPLIERAQDRLDRIGHTAPETPDYPSGLSQREKWKCCGLWLSAKAIGKLARNWSSPKEQLVAMLATFTKRSASTTVVRLLATLFGRGWFLRTKLKPKGNLHEVSLYGYLDVVFTLVLV